MVARISACLNLGWARNSDTFELHFVFLDADLIDASDIPHSPEVIHFGGVIFQTDHLNDRKRVRFQLLFHSEEFEDLVTRFLEFGPFAVLFVTLLGRSIKSKYEVIQTRVEKFAVAFRVIHGAISGYSHANVSIAAELDHFEDRWIQHRLAAAIGDRKF